MADKNFKVKSGLQVPSLTTAGPVTTDASGNVTSSSTLPISQGGTGQTTAGNALNALLPLQTNNTNKYLQTNGVTPQWNTVSQQNPTDLYAGTSIYTGTVAPSTPAIGDVWIDNTTGNGIQLVRWRKTIASATSTISGLDDNNLTLTYTAGNEQVYINGVLITRGQDYTATNGTSISLTQAVEVGDTVEIFGNPLFSVTDTYTQAQADSRYVNYNTLDTSGKNLVLNGGFDIWQRGTSVSYGTVSGRGADRWCIVRSGWAGGATMSRIDSGLPGIQYAARIQRDSGNTNTAYIAITQTLESINCIPYQGKQITLSFYARAGANFSNNGTQQLSTFIYSGTGTDRNITDFGFVGQTLAVLGYPVLTSSWQRFVYTGTLNSNITQLGLGFTYDTPVGTAGSNDYFDIAGIQIESGNIATPFSRQNLNYQSELAACQRYYYRYAPGTTGYKPYPALGAATATTAAQATMAHPVTMRSAPTSVEYSNIHISYWTSGVTATSLTISDSSTYAVKINVNATSGLTLYQPIGLFSDNNANSYIGISAEL